MDYELESEILTLRHILNAFDTDPTNPDYISGKVSDITKDVIYAFSRIEHVVDRLIPLMITECIYKKLDLVSMQILNSAIFHFVEKSRLKFEEKLEFLSNYCPKNLISKLKGINTLRTKFAHPTKNAQELRKYENSVKIINILKQLIEANNKAYKFFILKSNDRS